MSQPLPAVFPEIVRCVLSGDIEQLGVLARVYFSPRKIGALATAAATSPVIDPEAMLNAAGVRVILADGTRQPQHSALMVKDERGRFEVVAYVTASESERSYIMVHMLGHYLLHVMPLLADGEIPDKATGFIEKTSPLRRYAAGGGSAGLSQYDLVREEQADAFAAATLLPKGMLLRAQESIRDLDKLAQFFGVPKALLMRRLSDLNDPQAGAGSFIEAEKKLKTPKKQSPTAAPKDAAKPPAASSSESPSKGGMARIREIARNLDKAK